jgi:hypothetical protein
VVGCSDGDQGQGGSRRRATADATVARTCRRGTKFSLLDIPTMFFVRSSRCGQ